MLANLIKLIGPILSFGKGGATDAGAVNGRGATDGFATLLAAGVQPDAVVATPDAEAEASATLPPAETIPAADGVAPTDVPPITVQADPSSGFAAFSLADAPVMTDVAAYYRRTTAVEPAFPAAEADAIPTNMGEGGLEPDSIAWNPFPGTIDKRHVTLVEGPERSGLNVAQLAPGLRPGTDVLHAPLLVPADALAEAAAPEAPGPSDLPPEAVSVPVVVATETPVPAVATTQPVRPADIADRDIPSPSVPAGLATPPSGVAHVPVFPVQFQVLVPSAAEAEPNPVVLIAAADHPGIAPATATTVVWATDALPPAILATISDAPTASDDETQGEGASAPTPVLADSSAIPIPLIIPAAAALVAPVSIHMVVPPPEREGIAIAIDAGSSRRSAEHGFTSSRRSAEHGFASSWRSAEHGFTLTDTPAALRRKIEQAFAPAEALETSTSPASLAPAAAPVTVTASVQPNPAPAMPTTNVAADPVRVAPESAPPVVSPSASISPVESAPPSAVPTGPDSPPINVPPAGTRARPAAVHAMSAPGDVVSPQEAASIEPASAPLVAALTEPDSPPIEAAPVGTKAGPAAVQVMPAPGEAVSPLPKAASVEPASAPPAAAQTGTVTRPVAVQAMPAPGETASPPLEAAPIALAAAPSVSEPVYAASAETAPADAGPPPMAAVTDASASKSPKAAAAAAPILGTAAQSMPADAVPPPVTGRRPRAVAAQPADALPGTSEPVRRALSLLRVAERGDDLRVVARRTAPSARVAPIAPTADGPAILSQVPAGTAQPAPMPVATLGATTTTTAPSAPAAMLADRIVDLSVSGQWIDRLAQEIATMAVTDGTARFALHPQALGAMQVEIRHSDAGAAIRMLVETEGALNALKDAQPQLKADANLAAIRIAEIHIERRPLPAEASSTARDQSQQQSGQQQSGQQQSGQSGKDQGWTGSQNQTAANPGGGMGAGAGQTANQPYRKAPLIEAALNGPPGSRTDAEENVAASRRSRARYA